MTSLKLNFVLSGTIFSVTVVFFIKDLNQNPGKIDLEKSFKMSITWNINQQQQQRLRSTYINMLRKMVKGGFERRIDDNNEQTFPLCHVK